MAKAKKTESEETTKKTTPRKTRAKKVETAPVEEVVNEILETKEGGAKCGSTSWLWVSASL